MRALLSVADREGLAPLAAELLRLGIEVFATDGTREALAAEGVEVASVAVLTDVPALAGGQVKTFHPAIYAGILARRDRPEQLAELAAARHRADRPGGRQHRPLRAPGGPGAGAHSTRPWSASRSAERPS